MENPPFTNHWWVKNQWFSIQLEAGIWTNHVLKAMDLALLPLVTSIEQQTYYATPEGPEKPFLAISLSI